ncbi:fasciclin-like arabinogalactan protein 2 [Phalaenopsis equestris]|uniref:fasciclin-like arabinogalactan protein 2 n=1 Tax=Phalaenopsis equestris TaxID=78828 RepID=UPI0009E2EB91|nr:fasciclin-like arabinogalactan protein 2 [Phalaenopsis equestris]
MRRPSPPSFLLPLLLLLLSATSPSPTSAFNITKILAVHPDFSTFNHYLTVTHLASEINLRQTITVLAIDNAAMSSLLAKHLSLPTLKNVISLHVLVDYYGAKKLHQITHGSALASSLFQASGSAPGTSGFVNITDHRAGLVSFAATSDDPSAPPSPASSFVKSIKEIPYNISIIQISQPLSSPEAEAPAAAPAPVNLTDLMSHKGCALFAGLLSADHDTLNTFTQSAEGGLTVFCPNDPAVKAFIPKYKNLTAGAKASLLLYHGYPVYSSLQELKSNNGIVTTLATDGGASKNYNFTVQDDGENVTLETGVTTATITSTLINQDPVAVYGVDKVLQPLELFKPEETEAPSPAPAKGKKKGKKEAEPPADGPDAAPADLAADDNNAATGRKSMIAGGGGGGIMGGGNRVEITASYLIELFFSSILWIVIGTSGP